LTAFRKDDCYSDACPKAIKPWLLITFFSFYFLQLMTYILFKIKSRKINLWLWLVNSLILLPGMLALNVWGNMLIERMDDVKECEYKGYAQSFQMLFLISSYCVIFVYIIFLLTVKETLKRFYVFMDRTPAELNQRINIRGMKVNLIRGRSY